MLITSTTKRTKSLFFNFSIPISKRPAIGKKTQRNPLCLFQYRACPHRMSHTTRDGRIIEYLLSLDYWTFIYGVACPSRYEYTLYNIYATGLYEYIILSEDAIKRSISETNAGLCGGFNWELDSLGTISKWCRLNRIPSAFSSLLKPGKQWERALIEFQHEYLHDRI